MRYWIEKQIDDLQEQIELVEGRKIWKYLKGTSKFIKNDIYIEPVNKKQRESLKWRKHSEEFRLVILGIPGGEERALAGLKDLAKQILQGTES